MGRERGEQKKLKRRSEGGRKNILESSGIMATRVRAFQGGRTTCCQESGQVRQSLQTGLTGWIRLIPSRKDVSVSLMEWAEEGVDSKKIDKMRISDS